jgi:hypothetical protein
MNAAGSVTADFMLSTYALSVSKTGTGSGTVTSVPTGIDCGATCSANFGYNTSVTLTATLASGSTFTGWSGAGCSGTGTCQVTMDAAKNLIATFTQDEYTVSGTVYYYRDNTLNNGAGGEPSVKGVEFVGIGAIAAGPAMVTTGGTGAYVTPGRHGNVTITSVNKYGDPRASDHNGAISSLDASEVARASVGALSLSVNQILAGDVTGNGTLSALDASNVARFAVELVNHFPVTVTTLSDWRFLKCVPSYPGDCGSPVYTFTPITQTESGNNFYAILYGDVTGNWAYPVAGFAMTAEARTSPEEQAAIARDREMAANYKKNGAPRQVERLAGTPPADLSLSGWNKPLKAGERRKLTVDLRNADGILGLDLGLAYDPSRIAIVNVQAAGIGSGLSLAHSDQRGTLRIAAYGYAALSGSGSILTVTVEALKNTGNDSPLAVGGTANEGAIPLRVNGRAGAPSTRPRRES